MNNETKMNNENSNFNESIDWDDDSGVIHTIKNGYNITKEDGWQDNHANGSNQLDSKMQKIKGKQFGFSYVTDDYRKVIPGYIFGTIFIIILGIVTTIILPFMGLFIDVFGIVWIIAMWKNAPFTKWNNQAKKLKEEKKIKNKP